MTDVEIRSIEARHIEELVAIRRVSFLDDTNYDAPDMRRHLLSRLPHMTGVFRGEELVAAGAMLPFRMFRGGDAVPVGGLASVVSAAEHRHKGHVRLMLRSMLETLRDDGVGFCLEYPFDPRYYAKFGWQTIPNGALVEVAPGKLGRPQASSARFVDPGDEEATASIAAIYAAWAGRYNFTMTRDGSARDDWRAILVAPPWTEPSRTRFVYLLNEAYCVLQMRRKERGTVAFVVDCAWRSEEGRRELFGFWAGFEGQVDLFQLQLPYGEPALLDLTPHLVAHPHPLQARIVDVRVTLSGVAVRQPLDMVFTVSDEFCPWNQGTFRLVSDDGITRVEEAQAAAPVVDVRELMLLVADRPSADFLTHLPQKLREAFATVASRPAYMPLADYF